MKTWRNFAHVNARTLEEAATLMQKGNAAIIAGGTDLLGALRFEILPTHPEVVVNLKSIPGLDYIREEDGVLKIGALTRLEDIASLQSLRNRLAGVTGAESASQAAPQAEAPLEALLQAALAGHKVVLSFLDRVAAAFGLALNQLNCAFDPEKIILAGAFTVFGEVFRQRLEQSLKTFAPPGGAPAVVNSQLGPFNGAIGAAALAVHEWKPVPP